MHNFLQETFVRGPGQKVIAFTFYEPVKELKGTENKNDREYLNGIKANLELMKELYGPDWTMRVWTLILNLVQSHCHCQWIIVIGRFTMMFLKAVPP